MRSAQKLFIVFASLIGIGFSTVLWFWFVQVMTEMLERVSKSS